MQCILVKSDEFENSHSLLLLKSCLCCCSLATLAPQQLTSSAHLLIVLQSALDDLKWHLSRNGYHRGIISYNMNDVVNKHRNKPKDIITVSKIVSQQLNITRNRGHFEPAKNCQRYIMLHSRTIKSNMAALIALSEGKRLSYDVLHRLSTVDILYAENRKK